MELAGARGTEHPDLSLVFLRKLAEGTPRRSTCRNCRLQRGLQQVQFGANFKATRSARSDATSINANLKDMPRNLPPLNALKSFEAVMRLGSVTLAAAELNVTPGAVSRQLKTLEIWLVLDLFIRRGRQLVPTATANEYVVAISRALDTIDVATKPTIDAKESLLICSYPTFTQRWLVPRLQAFMSENPTADIRFITTMRPREQLGTDCDAAICVGMNVTDWGEWQALELLNIVTIAVCSPALMARYGGRIEFSDLKGSSQGRQRR